MKALLRTSLVVLAAALLSSCYTPARYAKNNAATKTWLDANAGSSRLSLTGDWYSEDWGRSYLKQDGNRVTGNLGRFPVGGVINGTTLYLAITDEGWTSYTAILHYAGPGVLEGTYSDEVPFKTNEAEPVRLVRALR